MDYWVNINEWRWDFLIFLYFQKHWVLFSHLDLEQTANYQPPQLQLHRLIVQGPQAVVLLRWIQLFSILCLKEASFKLPFLTSVRTLDKGWLLTRAAMKDSGLVGVYLDECLTTLLNVLKKTGFFVCNLMSLTQRIRSIWLESKEIFLLFQSNKLSCTL